MRERTWRGAVMAAIALACSWGGTATAADKAEPSAPIVPGYVRLRDEAKAPEAELGEVLLGELNCLQCHAAPDQKRILTKGAPDLSHAGQRMTPRFIREYLSNNHGMKPGTTMPDLFHASEPESKNGAVEFLTHYLVSLGGPMKQSSEVGSALVASRGRTLFHQVGCVACHAPEKVAKTAVPSVPFPNLAEKTTVEQLAAFLLDPLAARPGGRMPSLNLAKDEAHDIAVYLLREQLDNPQNKTAGPARTEGVKYTYYEVQAHTAALEKIEPLRPKSQGFIDGFKLTFPGHRNDNFAVKYSGGLRVPRKGKYTFHTTSDDGSRLYIGRQLVVDNDGVHAAATHSGEITLDEGEQAITVTYFQGGNDAVLKVEWEGPELPRQEIPASALFSIGGTPMLPLNSEAFTVNPEKARMGATMFGAIGCAACHSISGGPRPMRQHKALAELNPDSPTGCLGDQLPKTVPDYQLSADQRAALKAALKNAKDLDKPLEPKQQVTHHLAAFNCYACHVRDTAGGPAAERTPFFVMSAEFDMGDEGRFAPRLTNVGHKLRPTGLEQIIFHNNLHVRPVLATRMPTFSQQKAGAIVDAFNRADETGERPEPKFDAAVSKDGRTLFGTRGMGCVNCHGVNGVKSLGMPAPDLGNMRERLTYGWTRELLLDPAHVNPGTRMPAFWSGGEVAFKNLAGGTVDGQIGALWMYLSLGRSMPLPAGLNPVSGDELIPQETAIVHRTFFSGAGNRSIAVGYPELLHVAFDADAVRLAKAWKGRFFDAHGMWEGRGGQHLGPLGTDVIDLPPGPSFAVLGAADAPWPLPKKTYSNQETRNLGGRFKGYVLDPVDRPTFHYILGEVDIQEKPIPVLKAGGASLERHFTLAAKQPVPGLMFLAAQGKEIDAKSPTEWLVGGKLTVRLPRAEGTGQPVIREAPGGRQLLIPISFNNGTADFTVEMSW